MNKSPHLRIRVPPQRGARAGVAMVEMLMTLSIFAMVSTALITSHILGLKMYNISATKLSASAGARSALNSIQDEIRGAKLLYVGRGDDHGFSKIPTGEQQVGNAVQIYPSVNTNAWIQYYLDTGSQTLRRKTSAGSSRVLASYITNKVAFQAESHSGKVLTNDTNHRVVHMLLEFYQWEFPVAKVGGHYDYYRLQTRVTRRAIE